MIPRIGFSQLLLGGLVWIGVAPLMLFAQEDVFINDIRTQAPIKWAEYEQAFAGKVRHLLRVRIIDKMQNDQAKPGSESMIKYGTYGVLEYHQDMRADGAGYVFAFNDRYAFELKRKSPSAPWVPSEISLEAQGKGFQTSHMSGPPGPNIFRDKQWPFVGPFQAVVWLPDFFAKSEFQITKAEKIGDDGLVRIECAYTPVDRKKERTRFPHKGWIVLDSKHYWRVCECSLEIYYPSEEMGPAKTHWKVECAMDGEYPVLKRVLTEKTDRLDGKDQHTASVMDYEVSRQDSERAEFTLSAFGLDEPPGMPAVNRSSSWYLWIAVAAFCSFAVASGFRFYRRRKCSASAATN